ncbi:PilZ domain-containing protein [Thioalkalivibrio sp.]|uniref:PilZ domain-containing protein n=1 Tax=Thioalkalivibrio sp. TaxID=2093813 RepID=UPI0012D4C7A1|nr:PilZ domain-containing protein [Thioalkalivibrio sp.]TVP81597.1 MAG: hypothetical protein EA346_04660 [Thioalkalivibrio sp.]
MTNDPFEDALVYEDELPLSWEVVDALPPVQRLSTINAANEALLRAGEGLEEPLRGNEESHELTQEFQRLDAKLNLVLELLADWLSRQGDLPPALEVRFNGQGISWQSPETPPPDATLRLTLYVCPSFPKPLVLYGRTVQQQDGGPDGVAVARFLALSAGVVEGLERLVFRRHRREVAQLRGQLRVGVDHD